MLGERPYGGVLIGCEESQIVTRAFRQHGFKAFSCDLIETRGNPEWHIKADVMDVIEVPWDLIILHPPCTALSVSGNRHYAGTPQRQQAIEWTCRLWEKAKQQCHYVALENPVSVVWQHLNVIAHYVQPHQFGHGETKKTGFALHNLPPLQPTNDVEGREQRIWKMSPSPTRSRDRSETYPGIADAMAIQWGDVIKHATGRTDNCRTMGCH